MSKGGVAQAVLWLACACLAPEGGEAATSLQSLRLSPDVSLNLAGLTVDDGSIVNVIPGGAVSPVNIGGIPVQADVDAYHRLPNGNQLLSFDTTVTLPGGLTARPGDVVQFNGTAFAVQFSAALSGIPPGVNTDAVAMFGSQLLLSFDIPVQANTYIGPEDLVLWDGTAYTLFFDGATAGVGPGLDLDGADYLECNDHLLLSFDGGGTIGFLSFDDEDLLEYDRRAGTWEMAYQGSVQDPAWIAGDLDAVQVTVDLGAGPPTVFGQTIEASADQQSFLWPNPVDWKGVRGTTAMPGDVGSYIVDQTFSGFGTVLSDASVPSVGTSYWYLVKPRECVLTSWQSTLGAEPGRDAIP